MSSIGTVKWFSATRGYGYIQPQDGGQDVFVHLSAVECAGFSTLKKGQQVEYEVEATSAISKHAAGFYESDEWRDIRYRALKRYGGKCMCCGRSGHEVLLHVDHIKPRSCYPELELCIENLQILCVDCNLGKRAWDTTDWRMPPAAAAAPTWSTPVLQEMAP